MVELKTLKMAIEIVEFVREKYPDAKGCEWGDALLLALQGLYGMTGTANFIAQAAPKNTAR